MADFNTAWMWPVDNGGVNGLKIDRERGTLLWYDELGCACDDATITQSYVHYLAHGPAFDDAPDDVQAELHTAVTTLAAAADNDLPA